MAHNIMEFDNIAFGGQVPWHGLGIDLGKEVTTSDEMIVASGLTWNVSKEHAFCYNKASETYQPIPHKFVVYRDDVNIPLGIVGDDYACIQNHERFNFLDDIVGKNKMCYHVAGSLKNGTIVWVLLKLDESIDIGNDLVERYLLLVDSNDGSKNLTVFPTNVRVVCNNTLNVALSSKANGNEIRIRHSGDHVEKMRIAAKIMEIGNLNFAETKEAFDTLLKAKMTDAKFAEYLGNIFPVKGTGGRGDTLNMNKIDEITNIYNASPRLNGVRGTFWGGWNAITEYADHFATTRKSKIFTNDNEKKMYDCFMGNTGKFKQETFDLAMKMVA